MKDIALRLRELWAANEYSDYYDPPLHSDVADALKTAADEIERLRADRDHWRGNPHVFASRVYPPESKPAPETDTRSSD
jgi:hypothetical protein